MISVQVVLLCCNVQIAAIYSVFHDISILICWFALDIVICQHTVKPRPEAHMGMIPPEALLKGIGLTPQQQTLQRHYLYYS